MEDLWGFIYFIWGELIFNDDFMDWKLVFICIGLYWMERYDWDFGEYIISNGLKVIFVGGCRD